MTNLSDFARLEIKTRKKWGLTQEAMAKELGTSVACIKAWEYGQRNPPHIYQELLRERFAGKPTK